MRLAPYAFVLLVACSDPDISAPPEVTGRVLVRVRTTGADVDANGYLLAVDGGRNRIRVGTNTSLTMFGFSVGRHSLTVTDVAANCSLENADVVVTISAPREVIEIDFRATCTPLGRVAVTVATTGVDLDANGYRVVVRSVGFFDEVIGSVEANGADTIRVAPGRHFVSIQGIAPNCEGLALSPIDVSVESAQTAAVSFTVVCGVAPRLAFVAAGGGGNSEIYTVQSNGAGMTRLTNHPAMDEDPTWSPDGGRIAFTSTRDGPRGVYVMNQDGTGVTRLTVSTAPNYRPAWSPDGRRIAFVSERDGNPELYAMDADGANPIRLTIHAGLDTDPAWSPDGGKIAFTSERDGNAEIYVMNANGSGVARITASAAWDGHPDWSPDGNRLAFSRTICPENRWPGTCYQAVMITSAVSGSVPAEVGIGEEPAWSPQGTNLAVTAFRCDFYYFYTDTACLISGIGIVSPIAFGPGSIDIYDDEITRGQHRNPAWRRP